MNDKSWLGRNVTYKSNSDIFCPVAKSHTVKTTLKAGEKKM